MAKQQQSKNDQQPAADNAPATAAAVEAKPALPRFRVSHGEDEATVEAVDAAEAWAAFCDARQKWPSPKKGKVERVV